MQEQKLKTLYKNRNRGRGEQAVQFKELEMNTMMMTGGVGGHQPSQATEE